jgi:hypothetical protein
VHLIDGCSGIRDEGVSADEFEAMVAKQRLSLSGYASDFPGLLNLHATLCNEVEATLRELELPVGIPRNAEAARVTWEQSGHVEYRCAGDHEDGGWSCQFCAGGLTLCDVCGSFEGATTTHCPGRKMTAEQHDAVYAGRLDFRRKADGSGWWVHVGSAYTPSRGWRYTGE